MGVEYRVGAVLLAVFVQSWVIVDSPGLNDD